MYIHLFVYIHIVNEYIHGVCCNLKRNNHHLSYDWYSSVELSNEINFILHQNDLRYSTIFYYLSIKRNNPKVFQLSSSPFTFPTSQFHSAYLPV